MAKRILLFLITNVMVIATISIVMNLIGVQHYLSETGINYQALLIFCSLWGMGGAFISLAMSKVMAKWFMKVKIIDPRRADFDEEKLVKMVHDLAHEARLPKMPDVGIYDSPEVNAFATGPSKKNSLVAVSTGLLRQMSEGEIRGVLAHEVAHVANGDMVTMTLIQGVVNAFTMFLARIVAFAISNFLSDEEDGFPYMINFILTIVLDIIFSILGSIVVATFSRYREFKADAGGARLGGSPNMIAALQALKNQVNRIESSDKAFQTMKISNRSGFLALFSTHPPLEKRIARLQQQAA